MYALGKNKDNVPDGIVTISKGLAKDEFRMVRDINNNKYLVAGTPAVIEDNFDDWVSGLFQDLSAQFDTTISEEPDCDAVAGVRDALLNAWLRTNNLTLVYGSEEY